MAGRRDEKIPLIFVGNATYTPRLFVLEAKKYGVSRTVPINVLCKWPWGQKVLLAFWNRAEKVAEVFGYFVFEGITLPKAVADRVAGELGGAVRAVERRPAVVERGCGSYIVTETLYVDAETEDICRAAKKYATKAFANGPLHLFPATFTLPVKFTRSVVYVDAEEIPEWAREEMRAGATKRVLLASEKYEKVKRRRVKEKKLLERKAMHRTLDEFLFGGPVNLPWSH